MAKMPGSKGCLKDTHVEDDWYLHVLYFLVQFASQPEQRREEEQGIAFRGGGKMLVDPTLQRYGLFSGVHNRDGANFSAERERREQMNVAYVALRSLLQSRSLAKYDRPSLVGDAIEYINELNTRLKELKILVEKKRAANDRMKINKLDEAASDEGESSSVQLVKDDQDASQLNGAVRKSNECHVDVRIVDNEIKIKLSGNKRVNYLPYAAKVLDEFRLELVHVVGEIIGDHHTFMFNTKTSEGASVEVCDVVKKLFQVVEMQHLALKMQHLALNISS